ncbi:MAG TPA: SDR family oxidoreductase [Thermoanaerobaculia bacterium]|nr:SDR family oxidoreductase [Thermoanaerobaculia bacterium]
MPAASPPQDPASQSEAVRRGIALDRFVARHTALREQVDAVLQAAARLRSASRSAFAEPGLPASRRGQDHVEAARALGDAIDRVGADAAGPRDCTNMVRERVEAAVVAALDAALRLRVAGHAFSPPRRTTSAGARAELVAARTAFNELYRELERAAIADRVRRLPWQLELCSHHDPSSPANELTITGYSLPDTPAGRMPWAERCWLSGTPFHTDSRARPAVRYRSLDNVEHVLCESCRASCQQLRSALDLLAPRFPETVGRAAAVLPLLYDEYLPETAHPAFARLALTDFPSLAVALHNMLRAYAERPLFGTRNDGGRFATIGVDDRESVAAGRGRSGYGWQTFENARRASLRLAYGLERRGIAPGDRVALLAGENCREFYLAEFACVFSRLVVIAVPAGGPAHSVERQLEILSHTGARLAVCDGNSLAALVEAGVLARCPSLTHLVAWGGGERPVLPSGCGVVLEELNDLVRREVEEEAIGLGWRSASGIDWSTGQVFDDEDGAAEADARGLVTDGADEVFTIIFTSGSTGRAKGSVLTRRRWAEEACLRTEIWPHVAVSFQPSSAIADRLTVWRALYTGGRVGFARRGGELFVDARAIRPTVFDVPPVIWNTLYARYKEALGDADLDGEQAPAVRRRFRETLGGRVAIMAVGGAPPDPGVSRAMESIFGIPMFEGYAATEVGSIASNGVLVPGLDFKLVDRPELGLTAADQPHPRGELGVRSPRSTDHYFLDQDSSRESFTEDGYFLTGDLVELRPGGRVRILGRRKLFFKLAGAEFVSPEPLERAFAKSSLVEQILITALPTASSVVAVVVPARDGVDAEELLADLRRIAREDGLRACEVPAGVVLVQREGNELPWTAANGLLTPSYKVHRRALEERYRDRIAAAYARPGAVAKSPQSQPAGSPQEATAMRLRRVVASVIGVEPSAIDLDATFPENGGTSLSSMELLLRLEEVFADKTTARGDGYTSERMLQEVVSGPLGGLVAHLDRAHQGPVAETDREAVAGAEQDSGEQDSGAQDKGEPRPSAVSAAAPRSQASGAAVGASGAGLAGDDHATVAALASRDGDDLPPVPRDLPEAESADVFVTGATGLLGAHLLELLARTLPPGARIFALARAADHHAAAGRFAETAHRFGLDLPTAGALDQERGARLIAVAGQLERDRLGLSDGDWRVLARRVGAIYHLGAAVDHFAGYPLLRAANVLGTRRVLELATSETLKSLHFVSSVNVAMILAQLGARIAHEELPLPPKVVAETIRRNAGYAVTKLVSERLVQGMYERLAERLGRAPRFSVSRPSLISWSLRTGCSNPQDWLSRLLTSCLLLRAVPGSEDVALPFWIAETETSARGLDMVPVDWTAAAIARLGELTFCEALPAPSGGGVDGIPAFHVCNTVPGEHGLVSFQRLVDLLALADHRVVSRSATSAPPMRYLPRSRWMLEVEVQGAPFRPFVRRLKQSPPSMARAVTTRFVAAMGGELPCPGFDVETLLPYVLRHHGMVSPSSHGAAAAAGMVEPVVGGRS